MQPLMWPLLQSLSLQLFMVVSLPFLYQKNDVTCCNPQASAACFDVLNSHQLSFLYALEWTGHQTSNSLDGGLLAYYKKGYLNCIVHFNYVLWILKPSPPLYLYLLLILHNRLEDDSVVGEPPISIDAAEKAEVDPDLEAFRDLLVGVVLPKNMRNLAIAEALLIFIRLRK